MRQINLSNQIFGLLFNHLGVDINDFRILLMISSERSSQFSFWQCIDWCPKSISLVYWCIYSWKENSLYTYIVRWSHASRLYTQTVVPYIWSVTKWREHTHPHTYTRIHTRIVSRVGTWKMYIYIHNLQTEEHLYKNIHT